MISPPQVRSVLGILAIVVTALGEYFFFGSVPGLFTDTTFVVIILSAQAYSQSPPRAVQAGRAEPDHRRRTEGVAGRRLEGPGPATPARGHWKYGVDPPRVNCHRPVELNRLLAACVPRVA